MGNSNLSPDVANMFKTFINCFRCNSIYEITDNESSTLKICHIYKTADPVIYLCPKCSKELQDWLKQKKEVEKSNEET